MHNPYTEKSPDRLAIEGALQNATKAGTSLSNDEIAEATYLPYDRVRKITAALKQKGHIANVEPDPRKRTARYVWATTARKMPEFTLVFDEPPIVVNETPLRNGTTKGNWVAPRWEIARPEGEDHKQHGSLRGDRVEPWMPQISMCVGKGVEKFAPERLQR